MPKPRPEYTANELRILWYLKRHGPLVPKSAGPQSSLIVFVGQQLDINRNTVASVLRALEGRSLVLRTYRFGTKETFEGSGYNPIMRLELVDPDMYLPPMPPPLPLAAVVERENRELDEIVKGRTEHIPAAEAIVEALLNRIDELQGQVNKLQDVIEKQAAEAAGRERRERAVGDRLSSRVRDALPADVWDRLSH